MARTAFDHVLVIPEIYAMAQRPAPRRVAPAVWATAFLLTLTGAGAAQAGDVFGTWITSENSKVELFACGRALCGRLLDSSILTADPGRTDRMNPDPAQRGRSLKGLVILTNFQGGPEGWRGGSIYNAKSGETYSGSIKQRSADRLEITGCIMAPLCKTQTWTRSAR